MNYRYVGKIMGKKIAIVGGAGNIGSTLAFQVLLDGVADVVIIDIDNDLVKGKSLDILQALSVINPKNTVSYSNNFDELEFVDIIVVTAGIPRKPGMSREDLLSVNTKIISDIGQKIRSLKTEPLVIVVSNPLDIMVWKMFDVTGLPKNKVIGMAGVLDTARFNYFLSESTGYNVSDIKSFVLGGHGDFMLPILKYCTIANMSINECIEKKIITKEELDNIIVRTQNGGAEIVGYLKTGSAYFAPAMSILHMVKSYIYDLKNVMTCSVLLEGEYDIEEIFMGVPIKIGTQGVEEIITLDLSNSEKENLMKSVEKIKKGIDEVKGY